ncbi:MAG: hypothetical protein LUE86_05465 [Clostridiales bacterium]|nr:hypothetical protein [Clostridiales bacterium]
MRKTPTLFQREFDNHRVVRVLPDVTPGMEWVLDGDGIATIKWDGSCCAIIDGVLYKRYDAKHGKKVPTDAIPCEEAPDPVTGHLPCWRPCRREDPDDKWFWAAYDHCAWEKTDRTYEAIGPHFLNNPYGLSEDILIPHGIHAIVVERTYEGIRTYLSEHAVEGIVFWKDGIPQCKIKRKDFGFPWKTVEMMDAIAQEHAVWLEAGIHQ